MRRRGLSPIVLIVAVSVAICLAAAEMPPSFYDAMGGMTTLDFLCVKNYDAGASITESYSDFQFLNKDTRIISRSAENRTNGSILVASINSEVEGSAHLAWQSLDPDPDIQGRHAVFSRSEENLTGIFTIEKIIELSNNNTSGEAALGWLPCD